VLDQGLPVAQGELEHAGNDFQGLPVNLAIDRIRVACVAGAEQESKLQRWASESLGVDCEFARTEAETAGLVNSYADPGKMGVDRWLASIAAYHKYQGAVLVLDLGSALNAEVIGSEGRHLGGYIIPGQALMRKALFTGTEQVRFEGKHSTGLQPGKSTAEAVNHGIAVTLLGASRQIIEQAGAILPAGFNVVLTGGGAGLVRPYLPDDVDLQPDLVMDGLRWLLP
jgi:type III pantothenate kinase